MPGQDCGINVTGCDCETLGCTLKRDWLSPDCGRFYGFFRRAISRSKLVCLGEIETHGWFDWSSVVFLGKLRQPLFFGTIPFLCGSRNERRRRGTVAGSRFVFSGRFSRDRLTRLFYDSPRNGKWKRAMPGIKVLKWLICSSRRSAADTSSTGLARMLRKEKLATARNKLCGLINVIVQKLHSSVILAMKRKGGGRF